MFKRFAGILMLFLGGAASAQSKPPDTPIQQETDERTFYELLPPESASFRMRYEVTATIPGARHYFNPVR